MALKLKILDRVFPWLLIMVVLISCVPALPAAAASGYDVYGEWIFDPEVSVPPFSSLATQIGADISFESNDVIYVDIIYSNGFLSYELENGNLVNVYDYNTGWMYDTVRTVYFHTSTFDFDDVGYSWLSKNAIQLDDGSNNYQKTTIVIGDQIFDFSAPIDPPVVTMTITNQAATFTYGLRSFTWLNDNSKQTFLGFGMSVDDTEPVFSVGQTIALPTALGSDMIFTFYPLYSDSGTDVKTATFTIGSNTYVFEGTASSLPEVTMDVTSGGLTLSSGSTRYYYEAPANVLGFKLSAAADSYVAVGESYVFTPEYSISSYVLELFPFYSENAEFTTTIYVYYESGMLWDTFVFTAEAASPSVNFTVYDNSFSVESSVTAYSKPLLGRDILGFSTVPGSSSISYAAGSSYSLSGSTSDNSVYRLYLVTELSGSGGSSSSEASNVISGFVSSLINPVMAFFNVEFIPGFSFGKIALVAFVIGLVFWFLRMSK